MDNVKLLANEIRLELLAELRAAKCDFVVHSIRQRAEVLNMIDTHDFGATLLSAPAAVEPKESVRADGLNILADAEDTFRRYQGYKPTVTEPNLEFVRACLRFRDDGRDWAGPIVLETSDGRTQSAICAGLGGETALVRLDGVERMVEFSRFTGECIDAPYMGKLRIASSELYRVHPETYRVRERAGREVAHQGVNTPTKE